MSARGVADNEPYNLPTEDTISLMVQWETLAKRDDQTTPLSIGTAIYTASWGAPKSDVHSQQRFHLVGTLGEVMVDQAHRGYTLAHEQTGFASINPMYMKYTPAPDGTFDGQHGYGYRSFDAFVDAVLELGKQETVRICLFLSPSRSRADSHVRCPSRSLIRAATMLCCQRSAPPSRRRRSCTLADRAWITAAARCSSTTTMRAIVAGQCR